tara:strand:- start:338 stop:580 length:243 start_codon:yes stop_codon:yes gene_type:complete
MKLIDKIKPEVLKYLKDEIRPKYSSSYRDIIFTLSNKEEYRDLTIKEVDFLIVFLDKDLRPNGRTDFYYGDYLLAKEYQV